MEYVRLCFIYRWIILMKGLVHWGVPIVISLVLCSTKFEDWCIVFLLDLFWSECPNWMCGIESKDTFT
jgi:hypothetical protein